MLWLVVLVTLLRLQPPPLLLLLVRLVLLRLPILAHLSPRLCRALLQVHLLLLHLQLQQLLAFLVGQSPRHFL